jgi:hypothetical protein
VTVPAVWRNPLSALVVLLLFAGLFAIAPNTHRSETALRCDASGVPKATFPTMTACAEEMRRMQGCSCQSLENTFYDWYIFGIAPGVATVVGYLLLVGRLSRRLLWLNLAVAIAIIWEFVWAVLRDPAAGMAMPLLPAFVVGFCVGATALFLAIHYGRRAFSHAASAT